MSSSSEEELENLEIEPYSVLPTGTKANQFTKEQIHLLLELVEENKVTVECKKTDFTTIANKKAAWDSICLKFGGHSIGAKKNVSQLKKKWENLKRDAKKKVQFDS